MGHADNKTLDNPSNPFNPLLLNYDTLPRVSKFRRYFIVSYRCIISQKVVIVDTIKMLLLSAKNGLQRQG